MFEKQVMNKRLLSEALFRKSPVFVSDIGYFRSRDHIQSAHEGIIRHDLWYLSCSFLSGKKKSSGISILKSSHFGDPSV